MSERHALPHRSLPRGLATLESAPRALRRVGRPHPKPTPVPTARHARRGPRDSGSQPSPRFRGPGPAHCVADVLGPGPRSAHCARKSTYFAPSPGRSRPRCSRSWPQAGGPPAGRSARLRGVLVYMVQGLFPLFFHTPPAFLLPTLLAGRTDVKQAPLPLPRGRWPARPHSLALHQRLPGDAAGQSRCPGRAARDARSPRGPGRRTRVPEGRAAARGEGCAPRPACAPKFLADAFGLPASGSFAPATLDVWVVPKAARQPDGRGWISQRGPRRAAVGGWGRGGHSGCGGLGRNPR